MNLTGDDGTCYHYNTVMVMCLGMYEYDFVHGARSLLRYMRRSPIVMCWSVFLFAFVSCERRSHPNSFVCTVRKYDIFSSMLPPGTKHRANNASLAVPHAHVMMKCL